MTTLIVEDGSIIANANSFVDLVYIRAYAEARGITLSTNDDVVNAQAFEATDYLEAQRARYQGRKTDPANQELQFPRIGLKIDCVLIGSDVIPKELKNAECQLILEVNAGVIIQPTRISGKFITEDTVDVMTKKFSEKIAVGVSPTITAVETLLSPLFFPCGQRFALQTIRV